MGGRKATHWVEDYLYSARGHRALEQSVYAAGERAGFSPRRLRQAGLALGVELPASCWQLPYSHAAALDAHRVLPLEPALRALSSVSAVGGVPLSARRAA